MQALIERRKKKLEYESWFRMKEEYEMMLMYKCKI